MWALCVQTVPLLYSLLSQVLQRWKKCTTHYFYSLCPSSSCTEKQQQDNIFLCAEDDTIMKIKTKIEQKNLAAKRLQFDLLVF